MSNEKIFADLKKSIETWDADLAEVATKAAIEAGIPAGEIVDKGLAKGMEVIGDRFDKAEIYLPHVLGASKAMERALEILAPTLASGDSSYRGTVVMGTVLGDIHEIGKNVCCAMLKGAGYRVLDLGPDTSVESFLEAVEKEKADVVGGSALMTTTLMVQKDLVDAVNEENVPVKTMFGGAPCTQEWADEIGADGYSENAAECVQLVNRLLGK